MEELLPKNGHKAQLSTTKHFSLNTPSVTVSLISRRKMGLFDAYTQSITKVTISVFINFALLAIFEVV